MSKNLYKTLGISIKATQEEIKSVFRKKAKAIHPDVNKSPTAEEDFKRLNFAYMILSDPEKRDKYDNGEDVDINSKDPFRLAEALIMDAYSRALDDIEKCRNSGVGLLKVIEISLSDRKKTILDCINKANNALTKLNKERDKITKKSKNTRPDIFKNVLEEKIKSLNNGLKRFNDDLEIVNNSIELLSGYDEKFERVVEYQWMPMNSARGAATFQRLQDLWDED